MPFPNNDDWLEADAELPVNVGCQWGDEVELTSAQLPTLQTVVVKIRNDIGYANTDLAECLYDLPLTEGDRLSVTLPMGRTAQIEIVALAPGPAGLFRETTSLSLAENPAATHPYNDIGGLDGQIARVHEMVAVPLLRPELFERLGVAAPRGVLFTGPPGSGKTLLARSIAARTSAAFFQINGPEIISKHYGESEAALRKVFQAAQKEAPAIIFIDEIDAIAPKREALSGEKQLERRVVAQLLTLMDGLTERGRVILMAATNLPDSLDPALRRPGRFDREIVFAPPSAAQRKEILRIHLRKAPLAENIDLARIANESHGYVGADLAALAREASLAALERTVSEAGGEKNVKLDGLFITQADLIRGLEATSPSILRETIVESPTVTFADVGGLDTIKAALTEAVIWPQHHKATFAKLNLKPVSGVLLSGPPGSGKTLIARALATESGMNFIPVRPGRIMSQFLGDAERAVADVFAKARQAAPCIVFFDELDALAPRRTGKDPVVDRVVAQLLTEMDGLSRNTDVVVLAATNRAATLDPALTRPGRFDSAIQIPLPGQTGRRAVLAVHTADLPLSDDVDLDFIARTTAGKSGATLAALARAAGRSAMRKAIQSKRHDPLIKQDDFTEALTELENADRSLSQDFIQERREAYEEL
ncbi:AAA family ATPase [Cognatiyoonia sp. IB215446]|uniref:AAA family ATPase n=1 Tax=Cognatiyoonia sp. IB215446 TaxID=3097355 RepID=UPI002A0CD06A|nr:AAA family ATPase [Cognatiyoonia sp. IB215446]MDX8348469.1 AAA family ATPase [Cognatiyoonia sp. IB215446]